MRFTATELAGEVTERRKTIEQELFEKNRAEQSAQQQDREKRQKVRAVPRRDLQHGTFREADLKRVKKIDHERDLAEPHQRVGAIKPVCPGQAMDEGQRRQSANLL